VSNYDVIIIGAGACGLLSAIASAKEAKKTLLLEKLPKIATKLKATGGGRCNLTNTLDATTFMQSFGKEGRFMSNALKVFSSSDLIEFLKNIGVKTHAPDGFRVFPTTHNSTTIIQALQKEIERLGVKVLTSHKVEKIIAKNGIVIGVEANQKQFLANKIIIATGGKGYPQLGAQGDGFLLANQLGHKIVKPHPAMMPLKTKEKWVANCKANTIGKAHLQVDIKKYKKLQATGDLIFTNSGIRGPVVLDFSREITPLLAKFNEVPIVVNLTKGRNQEDIHKHFKEQISTGKYSNLLSLVETLLPKSIALELIKLANADIQLPFSKQKGSAKDKLIQLLAKTPLTIVGHDGFKMAMITRGGISLKEVDPVTLQSKLIKGLYFCGEVLNLDGPCGGYNLQWAFSSGYLAGKNT